MKKFGIIGFPLGHSFSPKFFNEKFKTLNIDAVYEPIELPELKALDAFMTEGISQYSGLNVTIPYKQKVIQYLDGLSPEAEAIGAVNVIKITDGKTKGYNTDAIGFELALVDLLKGNQPDQALVLGSGGASKSVLYVLRKRNIPHKVVSRTPQIGDLSYQDLKNHYGFTNCLIINTTPVGTWPNTDQCPDLPYNKFISTNWAFDLVYNPAQTKFLTEFAKVGAYTENGMRMLISQAEAAYQIWMKDGQ